MERFKTNTITTECDDNIYNYGRFILDRSENDEIIKFDVDETQNFSGESVVEVKMEDLKTDGVAFMDCGNLNIDGVETGDPLTTEFVDVDNFNNECDETMECKPIIVKTDWDLSIIEFDGKPTREGTEPGLLILKKDEGEVHTNLNVGDCDENEHDPIETETEKVENGQFKHRDLATIEHEGDLNIDHGISSVMLEDDPLDVYYESAKNLVRHTGSRSVFTRQAKQVSQEPRKMIKKPVFACHHCGYGCKKFRRLKKHIVNFHFMEHKPFKCDYCGNGFATAHTLKIHSRSHTGEKPFACDECAYTGNTANHLKHHKIKHTGEKPFKCEKCNFKCSRPDSLRAHDKRIHSEKRPHKCDLCDWRFLTADALRQHTTTHTGLKQFSCDYCEYRSNRAGNVKEHMRVHTGEKPFGCNFCDYHTTTRWNLKGHVKRYHTEDDSLERGSFEYKRATTSTYRKQMKIRAKRKPIMCESCGYKCSSLARLKRHMETHSEEKVFACDACNYRCSEADALAEHEKTHNAEHQFACTYCIYQSNSSSIFKRHMKTHTGKLPLACDACEYACRSAAALEKHRILHTGEKPFACHSCDYRSNTAGHLQRHIIRIHQGENTFARNDCEFRSREVGQLNKHRRELVGVKKISVAANSCNGNE